MLLLTKIKYSNKFGGCFFSYNLACFLYKQFSFRTLYTDFIPRNDKIFESFNLIVPSEYVKYIQIENGKNK